MPTCLGKNRATLREAAQSEAPLRCDECPHSDRGAVERDKDDERLSSAGQNEEDSRSDGGAIAVNAPTRCRGAAARRGIAGTPSLSGSRRISACMAGRARNGIANPTPCPVRSGTTPTRSTSRGPAPRELQGQQRLLQPGIVRAYPGPGRVLQDLVAPVQSERAGGASDRTVSTRINASASSK